MWFAIKCKSWIVILCSFWIKCFASKINDCFYHWKKVSKSLYLHTYSLTHWEGARGKAGKNIILKGKEFRIHHLITPNLFTASRNTKTTGWNVAGEQVIQCQRISAQMISFNNNAIQLGNTQHQSGSVFLSYRGGQRGSELGSLIPSYMLRGWEVSG